ncbi:MAG: MarR family transcriptional regulator [Candidatus Baltobacteraceae bacterium]
MPNEAAEALLQLSTTFAVATKLLDSRIGGSHGLSYAEVRLLGALASAPSGKMRPGELALDLGLAASGVTRAVLPLEKRGIVSREPDPRDARAGQVALTGAGKRLVEETALTVDESASALMRRLSVGQIRQLERLLAEIDASPAKSGGSRKLS